MCFLFVKNNFTCRHGRDHFFLGSVMSLMMSSHPRKNKISEEVKRILACSFFSVFDRICCFLVKNKFSKICQIGNFFTVVDEVIAQCAEGGKPPHLLSSVVLLNAVTLLTSNGVLCQKVSCY